MVHESTSKTQRAAQVRRACVGGLASALVLLQCVGLAHSLLVTHELCPEHGEFLHVYGGGAGSRVLALDSTDHDVVSASVARGARENEHEHCSVFLHQRTRALAGPTLGATELHVAAALRAAPPAAEVRASIAVLFFAPKNSPPSC
jgi:hypothetical protein